MIRPESQNDAQAVRLELLAVLLLLPLSSSQSVCPVLGSLLRGMWRAFGSQRHFNVYCLAAFFPPA